jgi:hypothetical protein
LNWNFTTNGIAATGFKLERSTNSAFLGAITYTITPSTTTWYTDSNASNPNNLQYNTTYYYRVCSYNSAGNSAWSNVASITTPPPTPPVPTSLTATLTGPNVNNPNLSILLTWNFSSNGVAASGFKLERSTNSAFLGAITYTITSPTTTYYSDTTGLNWDTTYYYRVCSYNSAGNSEWSNVVSITVPPRTPAAPSNLTAVAKSPYQVYLTWKDNSFNETGFRLERSLSPSFSVKTMFYINANVTYYYDNTVQPSTTYYYRICAYNGYGDSPYCNAK